MREIKLLKDGKKVRIIPGGPTAQCWEFQEQRKKASSNERTRVSVVCDDRRMVPWNVRPGTERRPGNVQTG